MPKRWVSRLAYGKRVRDPPRNGFLSALVTSQASMSYVRSQTPSLVALYEFLKVLDGKIRSL